MRDRELKLKLIEIADQILLNPSREIFCPLDNQHYIESKVVKYPNYNKLEIILICKECNINTVITKSMDTHKQEVEMPNDLGDQLDALDFEN